LSQFPQRGKERKGASAPTLCCALRIALLVQALLLSAWAGFMAKGALTASFKNFLLICTQWEELSAKKCGLSKGSDNRQVLEKS